MTLLFELIMAAATCTIISIALAIYVASLQPIQEVISAEGKEANLLRAIYIDEYARNFVRYGMKFILESGIKKLFATGGISPTQSTQSGSKSWINVTDNGMEVNNPPIFMNESIPIDKYDKILYYQWCSNATSPETIDCDPVRLDDLADDDNMKSAVKQSIENSFSLTRYLSGFSRFTQFFPEITSEGQAIDVTDTGVSATGEFRVVVKIGSYAGVNSSELITASTSTDILNRIKLAKEFVKVGGLLENIINDLDFCSQTNFDPESYVTSLKTTLDSTSIDLYTQWTNVTGSGEMVNNGKTRCIEFNTLHHMDPGDFRFRTEIYKCQNC